MDRSGGKLEILKQILPISPGVLRSTLPTMTLDESFEAKEKMAPWVWKKDEKNGTVASSKVGFPYDPYGF